MRILIACESSGRIREAFKNRGHDAWSCDLEDSEIVGNHIKDDILNHLEDNWDLMIAHPPCTYLSNVGNRSLYIGNTGIHNIIRLEKREEAKEFFMKLYNAPIKKICIENPVGYMGNFIKSSQIIHPYYFGEPFLKRTCLWLKNLRKLEPTNKLVKPEPLYRLNTNNKSINWTEGGVRSSKDRSRTFQGIANAMAEQWG